MAVDCVSDPKNAHSTLRRKKGDRNIIMRKKFVRVHKCLFEAKRFHVKSLLDPYSHCKQHIEDLSSNNCKC